MKKDTTYDYKEVETPKWKCFNGFMEKGKIYRFDDIISDEQYQLISERNKKWFYKL